MLDGRMAMNIGAILSRFDILLLYLALMLSVTSVSSAQEIPACDANTLGQVCIIHSRSGVCRVGKCCHLDYSRRVVNRAPAEVCKPCVGCFAPVSTKVTLETLDLDLSTDQRAAKKHFKPVVREGARRGQQVATEASATRSSKIRQGAYLDWIGLGLILGIMCWSCFLFLYDFTRRR
jgi:hypothetical protein